MDLYLYPATSVPYAWGYCLMLRIWLFLSCLLGVLAVGVVSAVSAPAETCTGGSHVVFCTSPGNIPMAPELILGTSGLSLFAGTLGGASARFHCLTGDIGGTLESLGAFLGLLLFLSCKEEKPLGCKLSMDQELNGIHAIFTGQQESATLATLTGRGPNETLTALEIENKPGETCVSSGSFSVTGKQMVETPKGGEGVIRQEIVAKKVGSSLKFAGSAASFSTTAEVHLGGTNKGSTWLVMAGE